MRNGNLKFRKFQIRCPVISVLIRVMARIESVALIFVKTCCVISFKCLNDIVVFKIPTMGIFTFFTVYKLFAETWSHSPIK